MTADEFRNLALSLPEAAENAHMNHPDFRVCGKIFATLGPDEAHMVKRILDEQLLFVRFGRLPAGQRRLGPSRLHPAASDTATEPECVAARTQLPQHGPEERGPAT